MKFTKNMYKTVIILILILIMPLYSCSFQNSEPQQDDSWNPPCDELEDSVYDHEHSFSQWIVSLPASCSAIGQQQRICSLCGFYECSEITRIPHTIIIDLPISATCTTTGKSEGKHCLVCNEIIVEQEVIEKIGHTIVTDLAIAPTCTSSGKSEGAHCGVCQAILIPQTEIEALGHVIVTDPAIVPTCTSNGKSEGKHCSACNEIFLEQKIIEKTEHTIVTDPAIAPTCTSSGKSEGAYCGVCQTIIIKQFDIEALGHKYDSGVITDIATFWKQGEIKFSCSVENCNSTYYKKYSVTTITQVDQNTPIDSNKLYSFCAISDVHLTSNTAEDDFIRALTYAEENCDFTCVAGDLTNNANVESQLATYKNIVDAYSHDKPVYAIAGNHEHYSNGSYGYLEKYTGKPLYYSFTKGNDVFIMMGHYGGYAGDGIGWRSNETWSAEELQWLYETLEANRNKRCFIFTHVLPHEHGVGNPKNSYVTSSKPCLWYVNDGGIGQAFMSLLKHYKNTILFHGHSHTRLDLQNLDFNANCSDENGYRSVHIPSISIPRDIVNGVLVDLYDESEGYIIDVYDDYIILKGRDFIDNDGDGHWIKNATYKIDTRLYNIEANTFTDSTGTIKVIQK